ncbi:YciI family protein [Neptunicella marina]|uniref:YCII-related domain-containing protein n=1 Tax=Neptunicella marina TaxID=2125989 RepID=A0A8J6IT17_9ALTE|nr:YciI family protein [Neptunicella marina]MBC3765207.1 hypothetical protein [Neptunicella marina]
MFLVDMHFSDMSKVTPELTELHKAYLAQEYAKGQLAFGGRKVPRTGGFIISKHTNQEELVQVLDSDPFIKQGAAIYTIKEFEPVMASDAFAPLLLG